MDIGIIVIVVVVLIVLGLIRKASTLLKLVITIALAAILTVVYILIFPTSPISKTITSWVAQSIEIDPKDEHKNGEVLFEYSLEDLATGASQGLDGLTQALTGNEQLSDFFSKRLAAFAESQAKELAKSEDKIYKLSFKDSYLKIDCSDIYIIISIVKEEQTDKVPA